MKLFRYVGLTLIGLILLVVVAAGAAFFLVPADRLVALAVEEVRDATGRELTISGEVSPSIYPVLGATVTGASLSNADWAAEDRLISVGEAKVGVRLAPLLSGRIEIEEIRLADAVISMEVSPDGQPNWTFEEAQADAPAEPPKDDARTEAAGDTPSRETPSQKLERLGQVNVIFENAAITFDNRQTGRSVTMRRLSLSAQLESPDQPLMVDASGSFNDRDISVSLALATPLLLAHGETAQADLSVRFSGANLAFKGAVTGFAGGAQPSAKGPVSLSVPNLPDLIDAAGAGPIAAPKGALKSFSMDGQLAANVASAELSGLALTLDEETISGEASVDLSAARPMIVASFLADDVDLAPYLAATTGGGSKGGGKAGGGSGGKSEGGAKSAKGWSTDPIDLSGLKALDADISIKANSVALDKGTIRNADIQAALRDGVLSVTINTLRMFDGSAAGTIRINGKKRPAIAADLNIDSVQLLSLLATLAEFDRLEGVGAANFNVRGRGGSLNGIMNSLKGKASVKLTDGAILGINLAAMARNATGAFLAGGGEAQKTDFAEISASFDIREGVAANSDMIFLGPLLRAQGAGTINIGAQTLNYRVTPRAVASIKGQGGDAGLGGLAVPVNITGSWFNPKFSPDLAGAITGIVTDPAGLAGTALGVTQGAGDLVGDVGQGLGDVVEGLLGGGGSGGGEESGSSNPLGGALEGLFGR